MTIKRRLLIYTSVIYIIGAILVVLLVNSHMRRQALTEAESKAMLVLDRNLATHTFYTHQLKPRIFEWSESFRTPEYFEPVWMSSTYAVREIDQYFKTLSHNDYYYKECAINARSPQNEADSTEHAFIRALNDDPALMKQSMIRVMDGKQYFQTLRRGEMMEETCLRCHSSPERAPADLVRIYGPTRSFNRQSGEAITAISIRIPLSAAYAEANRFSVWLSGLLICVLLGIYVGQHQINRFWLLRPLEILRDKVTEISGNTRLLGETLPLPRGQELQDLGTAFNSLSKALKESVDKLEDRVADRTRELHAVNIQLKQEMIQKEKLTAELIKSKKLEAAGILAAGIAHDFNNLMAIILGNLSLIQLTLGQDASRKPLLNDATQAIQQARELTQKFISMASGAGLDIMSQPLAPILEQAIDLAGVNDNRFQCQPVLSHDLWPVAADADELVQALRNILINAREAMPSGGVITLSAENRSLLPDEEPPVAGMTGNRFVQITIRDQGDGIPPENLSRIFDPYFSTRDRFSQKGMGLGLSIAYVIIQKHGGFITVESLLNAGTTVSIFLPASADQTSVPM